MTRILIADDLDFVRADVRAILAARPDWELVGEASDGGEAVKEAVRTRPDIVILDYSLSLLNGVEAARQIKVRIPGIEILILSRDDNDSLVRHALAAGARGFLLKSDARLFLLSAVESLANHQLFFTGKVSEMLLDSYLAKSKIEQSAVSSREKLIIQLISEGKTNKLIADILSLSTRTVETYRASAMRKLNVVTTAGLVRYAILNGLVE
jgi:DNA-binding NarL/FixJ family response regulator